MQLLENTNLGWECPVCHIGIAPWWYRCPKCNKKSGEVTSTTDFQWVGEQIIIGEQIVEPFRFTGKKPTHTTGE